MTAIALRPMRFAPLVIFTLLLTVNAARAADLTEVYVAAKAHDPVLGAARASLDANRQAVPQARSALLPNLTASASRADNDRETLVEETFTDEAWQVQLRQPIVNVESWFDYRSARSTVQGAESRFAATEQELISRAVQAYLNVLRADALLDSALAQEAAVKRQLEQVQQRFEVGLVAITDVLEAQAAYDDAVVLRVQAAGDHDIFFEVLRTLTGRPYTAIDAFAESLPVLNPNPSNEEEWVTRALAENLQIQAAEKQLKASEQTLRARRSGHLPTLTGSITESHFETDGLNFFGSEVDQTVIELALSMPIYQGGLVQSRAREARAQTEQARQQLLNQKLTVSRDTRNLFRAVATDVVRVKARRQAIASAQSALEATETGYEVGTRNIVDVLDAQQRLFRSQFDYADSRYTYVADSVLLKQTAGTLSPEDVDELNQHTDAAAQVERLDSLAARSLPAEDS